MPWAERGGDVVRCLQGKYILSTRIRSGPSIKGFALNPLMEEKDYKEMEHRVKAAVEGFQAEELKGKYYPLLGMSKDVQTQLIKDHFLFKDNDRHLVLHLEAEQKC